MPTQHVTQCTELQIDLAWQHSFIVDFHPVINAIINSCIEPAPGASSQPVYALSGSYSISLHAVHGFSRITHWFAIDSSIILETGCIDVEPSVNFSAQPPTPFGRNRTGALVLLSWNAHSNAGIYWPTHVQCYGKSFSEEVLGRNLDSCIW